MEHFGSLPGTPTEECLRIVRGCRAYIGIFAMRYGGIDPETGNSITELEYDEAQRFHLRSLLYLIDEDRQPVLPKHVDFGEAAEKLRSLKSRLKQHHVVSFFTTPDDLAMRVTQDVARLMQDGGLSVEQSALSRIIDNASRAVSLSDKQFGILQRKIGSLADPIGSDVILREALQFLLCDDYLAAGFLVTRSTSLTLLDAVELLTEITDVVCGVVLRGYKHMEQDGRVSPEFVVAFEQYVSKYHRIPPWTLPNYDAGNGRSLENDPESGTGPS